MQLFQKSLQHKGLGAEKGMVLSALGLERSDVNPLVAGS